MKEPDWKVVRNMNLPPSDDLLVWYVPDWMKPYLRLELKRYRKLQAKQ